MWRDCAANKGVRADGLANLGPYLVFALGMLCRNFFFGRNKFFLCVITCI